MKQLALFIFGLLVGVAICFIVVYVIGFGLQALEIQLYSSEFDQQRNFNIVMGLMGVAGLVSGIWWCRLFKYKR